jgi:zinc D-Ala-D-Ala carboxypeptidase
MENISAHITAAEAIRSDAAKRAGINNYYTPDQLARMKVLAEKVFEPLRMHFKVPLFISSFFRSPVVNKMIGGAKNSQHMANNGAAMDIDAEVYGKVTNKEIFNYIKDNLEFDQLIGEGISGDDYSWVHCSYNEGHNRKEILIATFVNGVAQYKKYEVLK